MIQVLKSLRFIILLTLLCFPLVAQTFGSNQPGEPRGKTAGEGLMLGQRLL